MTIYTTTLIVAGEKIELEKDAQNADAALKAWINEWEGEPIGGALFNATLLAYDAATRGEKWAKYRCGHCNDGNLQNIIIEINNR